MDALRRGVAFRVWAAGRAHAERGGGHLAALLRNRGECVTALVYQAPVAEIPAVRARRPGRGTPDRCGIGIGRPGFSLPLWSTAGRRCGERSRHRLLPLV